MMKAEFANKTPEELRSALYELRREQFNLRMQRASDQLASPARMRAVRRDIARIQTRINEQRKAQTS